MTALEQTATSPTASSPAPESGPPPAPPSSGGRWWSGWRFYILLGLFLFAFRSSVLDWNVVPSGSMKPTIVEGDYILVNKVAYDLKVPFTGQPLLHREDPRRGDIVVFIPPGETDRFVKRVVAGPGDRVELRDNVLLVNGQPASYEPLIPNSIRPEDRPGHRFERETVAGRSHAVMLTPGKWSADNFEPLIVPAGYYFMLGDNRDDSRDSRYFGLVSRDRVIGRAWSVSLSLEPGHGPRWQRFFSVLS